MPHMLKLELGHLPRASIRAVGQSASFEDRLVIGGLSPHLNCTGIVGGDRNYRLGNTARGFVPDVIAAVTTTSGIAVLWLTTTGAPQAIASAMATPNPSLLEYWKYWPHLCISSIFFLAADRTQKLHAPVMPCASQRSRISTSPSIGYPAKMSRNSGIRLLAIANASISSSCIFLTRFSRFFHATLKMVNRSRAFSPGM